MARHWFISHVSVHFAVSWYNVIRALRMCTLKPRTNAVPYSRFRDKLVSKWNGPRLTSLDGPAIARPRLLRFFILISSQRALSSVNCVINILWPDDAFIRVDVSFVSRPSRSLSIKWKIRKIINKNKNIYTSALEFFFFLHENNESSW